MRRLLGASLLAFPVNLLVAQQVPARPLGSPQVKFANEYSAISGIRELADGRLIVLDAKEKVVYLVDPRSGDAARIGREGSGPGEYLMPINLLALPADTTLVFDPRNNRYLVIGADGKAAGSLPIVQLRPAAGITYGVSMRHADGRGNFYYAMPSGLAPSDDGTTPVLRYDRATQRSDTVARITQSRNGPTMSRQSAPGGTRSVSVGSTPLAAFDAQDEWVVAPDGSVGVVRGEPYRVEWFGTSGAPVVGPTINFTRVKIGEGEKAQWRKDAQARGGPMVAMTGPDGRVNTQTMPVRDPDAWPEFKPAFVSPAVRLASDGNLWVARAAAAASKVNTYDVFDRTGKLVHQVTMPSTTRVVGFGRGVVYVARQDEDDLLHLERHALPQ